MEAPEINGYSSCTNGCATNDLEDWSSDKRCHFLLQAVQVIMKEAVQKGTANTSKVVEFLHPKELRQHMDLDLVVEGLPDSELLKLCQQTIQYSVKTGHRRFFNQLYSGLSVYGLAGAWLSDSVNTSQYTYEVAPVFTLMEQTTLAHMAAIVGYEKWDGIFCPGGSISNMYGLNLARYHAYPEVKVKGLYGLPRLCVFTSQHAHYSLKKGAALLGLGIESVVEVSCDDGGRMDPAALEEAINNTRDQGHAPFFVNATSGTTVAGAYDPLEAIADICQRHKLWLHVDCCWGGGALLSRKHKHLLRGIERADSLSWNPHKMMGAPLQTCVFLTSHTDLLHACHSASACYLFQQDKFYDVSYDTGDKSIQCGRKVDVFKLWLMWKAKGDLGFERDMDNIFENARYLTELVRKSEGFRLVFSEPECTNVCFWYIPPTLRALPETPDWWRRLGKVAPLLKERMVMKGSMMIGYQPLGERVNFFRMVISNTETREDDMAFCLQEIQRLGQDLDV